MVDERASNARVVLASGLVLTALGTLFQAARSFAFPGVEWRSSIEIVAAGLSGMAAAAGWWWLSSLSLEDDGQRRVLVRGLWAFAAQNVLWTGVSFDTWLQIRHNSIGWLDRIPNEFQTVGALAAAVGFVWLARLAAPAAESLEDARPDEG
jgi:hypothetical protein